MVSNLFVFAAGCVVTLLCTSFVVLSFYEIRRLDREAQEERRETGS